MSEIAHSPADAGEDAARRGLAFYREKLQPLLEPDHNGEVVAIHIDSGDYLVAPSSGKAMRAMRELHEEANCFCTRLAR